jgi:hypothetical protein
MKSTNVASALALALAAAVTAGAAGAQAQPGKPVLARGQFERTATFVVCTNTSCDRDEVEVTSSEIVAASQDGNRLIYTDSPNQSIGFIDVTDPHAPKGMGALELDGEPTSVAVAGPWVLVAVNTSASYANPSGYVEVFQLASCASNLKQCAPVARLPLGGQPDSVAVSPDGRYAAIAIENERDEDVTVDGIEGGLPQTPAGLLQIVDLKGAPGLWATRPVDLAAYLAGKAVYGATDPEPEYVAINAANVAAVTLQENNYVAFVDLATGAVIGGFEAGAVDLAQVDADDEKLLDPVYSLDELAREPDSIAWIGTEFVVTANEGDLFGGSRGFTIFGRSGNVVYDSGIELEHLALAHGHYPDKRADNKGVEPEAVATARIGGRDLLFVGSERANFVAVYDVSDPSAPQYQQFLPTGIGPEGLATIAKRGLLAIASEEDEDLRSTLSLYQLKWGEASYPSLMSELRKSGDLEDQAPIGWVALSALAADRDDADVMYTAHDSFLNQSRIFEIDVSGKPARIVDEIVLKKSGATVNYDIEGLAQRAGGGFWVVSEGSGTGAAGTGNPNLLVKVAGNGTIEVDGEIGLPAGTAAKKRSNGFEGVAVTGSGASEQVYVVFQREWDGDPPRHVRIGRYTPSSSSWAFYYYPLDPVESPAGGWVGLSELVALDDGKLLVLERDNQAGLNGRIKRLYSVSVAGLTPAAEGGSFPLLAKSLVRDIVPDLLSTNGWLQDKPEGVTVTRDGGVFLVTDNDGVDKNTGETMLLELELELDPAF